MGRRRLPPLLSVGLGGNTPLVTNGSSALRPVKQRAEDVLRTNNTDFQPATLHITSTLEDCFFFREELLPVFHPRWKELDVIKTIFFLFLKTKIGKKSEVLCPGIGSNDCVLPGGDFIILPLISGRRST